MIHRICFDGHFSSIKTLVEKLRRCFQALPHLIYIIKYIVQSFKMPILHRVQNGQSKFLTMKPKTHKKVQKKKSLFHFCAQIIAIQLSPRIVRKKRKEDTPPATRGHRTARLVKERERERKKERKTVAPRAWWWWCRRGEGGRFPKEN